MHEGKRLIQIQPKRRARPVDDVQNVPERVDDLLELFSLRENFGWSKSTPSDLFENAKTDRLPLLF